MRWERDAQLPTPPACARDECPAGVAKAFTKLVHETSALLEGTDLLESESSRKTGLLLPQKMVDAPDEEEIAMRMCVLW